MSVQYSHVVVITETIAPRNPHFSQLKQGFLRITVWKVLVDVFECNFWKRSLDCGGQLSSDLVLTVLRVMVFLGCWLTWLLVFVQRGKEELRKATALLTAQQTSLEIIVNMCCSDGECCGHGQQCSPQALFISIISCDMTTQYLCLSIRKPVIKRSTWNEFIWVAKDTFCYCWAIIYMCVCICLLRPVWRWVGGVIEQRWERHGSRRSLWWSVQSDVTAVFVSGGSRGLNQPQHPCKGKYLPASSITPHTSVDSYKRAVHHSVRKLGQARDGIELSL